VEHPLIYVILAISASLKHQPPPPPEGSAIIIGQPIQYTYGKVNNCNNVEAYDLKYLINVTRP